MQNKKKFFGLLTSAALLLSATPLSTFAEEMIEVPESIGGEIEENPSYINESIDANTTNFTENANTATSVIVTPEKEQQENRRARVVVTSFPYALPTDPSAFSVVDPDGKKVKITKVI